MKKIIDPITKKELKWYTAAQVFGKARKSKEFQKAYKAEVARLKLAYSIRKSREAKKMTQAAVAREADMPQSVIARLESGTHSVSVATLSKVANALGKQVELV
ncbi:MAG: helix-turn-helix transcriptional regulator [Patescibacteria group bacterium]